ncbi:S41 family peptidase [Deminuibacter soli]|uniref:PDZ domain-containing protein n=1 Tax=Deminuibacter soli TaxID=2291815 RepID=A0A3E1NQQ7_9BACT|nr:S41 family peptidase [Deminuibacter soli]RFM30237.1 hypothetical protein DXN05_04505 [Deminuibacter soli]
MKKTISTLLLPVCLCTVAVAQQQITAVARAKDAFLITRLAATLHVQPRALNEVLSNDLYNSVLETLDDQRMIFTSEDMRRLEPFRYTLHQQIAKQQTAFLTTLVSLYNTRIRQADTMVTGICSKPFHLGTPELLGAAEDTSYPAGAAAMRAKLYKIIKLAVLNDIAGKLTDNGVGGAANVQHQGDSLEAVVRKKTAAFFHRNLLRYATTPHGLTDAIGNIYCKSLANCYDPHTEYFPVSEKENFDSELGQKRYRFGFQLKESENGDVSIDALMPGSPAFRSGMLNVGDKLVTLQWQGEQPVDIEQAGATEISSLLSSSNHDQLYLTVKKTDGSLRKVPLVKEIVTDDADEDADKVKNFLLKGQKNIGYILLPAFYTSWGNDPNDQSGGCANDVTKAIIKLKKDKLDGLILDLRFNGGGSLQEAVALAGIFINAGPVLQLCGRDTTAIVTLRDVNRGTVYDGPLMILVNGYSASASEILAGTLQDYHRAVIAGSDTYGKATSQVVWPLDTVAIRSNNPRVAQTASYLKVTGERLYRITGEAAQFTGVIPDIALPDVSDYSNEKEKNEPFALHSKAIAPNKYYRPYPALPLAAMQQKANTLFTKYPYFTAVKNYGTYLQQDKEENDVQLTLADALKRRQQLRDLQKTLSTDKVVGESLFTVETVSFDAAKIKADALSQEMNEIARKYVATDPYIHFAFALMSE